MILDFFRDLAGDFVILTLSATGAVAAGVVVYLFILMELERRREKRRIANGEMSELEITILKSWSRL